MAVSLLYAVLTPMLAQGPASFNCSSQPSAAWNTVKLSNSVSAHTRLTGLCAL
jgi:hypothetical protein